MPEKIQVTLGKPGTGEQTGNAMEVTPELKGKRRTQGKAPGTNREKEGAHGSLDLPAQSFQLEDTFQKNFWER